MSDDSWKAAYELGILATLHQRVFGTPAPEFMLPEDVQQKCEKRMQADLERFIEVREADGLMDSEFLNLLRVLALGQKCEQVIRLAVGLDLIQTWQRAGILEGVLRVEDDEGLQ